MRRDGVNRQLEPMAVHRGMPVHTRGPEVECWLPYAVLVSAVSMGNWGGRRTPIRRGLATHLALGLPCPVTRWRGTEGVGRTPAMAWLLDWRYGLVGGVSQGITSGRRRRLGRRCWLAMAWPWLRLNALGCVLCACCFLASGHGTLSGTTGMEKTPS